LLSNAVKFTQTGVVTLNVAYTPDAQLQLSVQDTGIGMSEEQLARIFDPFAQADASTTRRFGGTGLGTTIARQLVQLMGGDITVSSQQGQGSQFCVHLWLELGRAVGKEAEAVVQLPPLRILAADDIPDNLELLQLVLQRHGHSIRTASNGLEATRLYEQQEQAFDIILMDLHMPQMDGFDAARSIRRYEQQHQRSATPILALSASVLEEDRVQAKQAGMQGFTHKPIHLPTLLKEIQRVLGLENSTSTSAGTTAQSASSTRTSTSTSTSTSTAADILPPTLWNKAAALDLWGSQEAWQQALQRYMQQHQAAPERLEQLCAQADWPALKALAHSLRGVAANLQLLPIQAALQAIEQAVRQQPALQPPTPVQLAAFAQAWQQVQQALFAATAATAVDGSPSATTAPPSTSITLDEPQRQALATLLATLQADLACGQLPSEELLAQVSDLIANHHSLQALQEALEQFDFNQAQQHLQALQALAAAA
ncbi:MAG: response regulator, partial [Comamonas sp.]|nr:response regulator [Comamonas sp.]